MWVVVVPNDEWYGHGMYKCKTHHLITLPHVSSHVMRCTCGGVLGGEALAVRVLGLSVHDLTEAHVLIELMAGDQGPGDSS